MHNMKKKKEKKSKKKKAAKNEQGASGYSTEDLDSILDLSKKLDADGNIIQDKKAPEQPSGKYAKVAKQLLKGVPAKERAHAEHLERALHGRDYYEPVMNSDN